MYKIKKDFVYAATSPLLVGFCKIGTSDNAEQRVSNLYGDWGVFKTWAVDNGFYYESLVKNKMRPFRAVGYEVFNCPVEYLVKVVEETIKQPTPPTVSQVPKTFIKQPLSIKTLGSIIEQERKKQNLSIQQLSGLCDCGYRFISDVENGKETCRMDKLFILLRALGIEFYLGKE